MKEKNRIHFHIRNASGAFTKHIELDSFGAKEIIDTDYAGKGTIVSCDILDPACPMEKVA